MSETIKSRRQRSRLWPLLIVLLLAGGGAAAWYWTQDSEANAPVWQTAKIARGTIASTVSASGTLKAVVTVEVGSQISGQIKELYADFNSEVKANQKIALIDPATFEAKLREAEADLAVARANITMNGARLDALTAEIRAAEAALAEARADFDRKKELMPTRAITRSDFGKAEAAYNTARAKLDGAKAKKAEQQAQVLVARAQVQQKEATLQQRKLDLERTVIRSPVDGVVIARNIDVGQTVAASLQAPVLFVIAKDLREMQVEVNVDEADIGRIQVGQGVEFTVDSFPGRTFPGTVKQVRLLPKDVSNVVTYTVIVSAENPDLRLLPGLTANVTFNVSRRDNVVVVPNRALRFRPPGVQVARPTGTATNQRRGRRGGQMIQRLARQLKLTPEQQKQLREISTEQRAKFADMRAKGASREDMRAQFRKMRAQMANRINAILTPEQRRAYAAMRRGRAANPVRRGQVWTLGDDGQPKVVSLVLGISDGANSEVLRGLEPGDTVLTGLQLGGSSASTRRRRGPRLRF